MKLSEQWLREWFDPAADTATNAERLTLAGLEVERLVPVAPALSGVVVAEIRAVARHPDAEHLTVCAVFDGLDSHQVVCGAHASRHAERRSPSEPICMWRCDQEPICR